MGGQHGDARVADHIAVALFGDDAAQGDDVGTGVRARQGGFGGALQGFLDARTARLFFGFGLAGQAVGGHDRVEGADVGLHQADEPPAQRLGLRQGVGHEIADLRIVLLADGQVADHGHQGRPHGAHDGRGAPASRGGGLAGQFIQKLL